MMSENMITVNRGLQLGSDSVIMKFFFTLLLALVVVSCTQSSERLVPRHERVDISTVAFYDSVWICTSSGAKRFHASDTCGGVLSCGEDIVPTTRHEAEKGGRTYCHKCYTKNH